MSISDRDPMTSNHEIKSQLAKLLATEDLVVEHKKVETAQFNVQSRVLTLPMWENTTNDVIDMLVSHEVGHALYTPDREWWKDYQMNPSIVNIVEDARIEKLMKRRYEGIANTFYRGYTELHKKDFFQVKQKDISEMNLLDRINLQFKIGTHYNIPFSTDEMFYVNKVSLCETFDEVLKVSKQIFDYILGELEKKKEEEEKEKESQQSMPFSGNSGDGEPSPWDDWDDEDAEDADEEEGEAPVQVKTQMGGTGSQSIDLSDEVVSETAESLEEALKNLANTQGRENVYLELPKLDIDELIIDNELIHNLCKTAVSEIPENDSEMPELYSMANFIEQCKVDFVKFKRSAQKEVNYLVKEFECKKSAGAYARATTSRTGVLDTSNLVNYKFSEDLFKKVTLLPDGKNHGLVFILDWSGSMATVMEDTIKQLYNLLWFCKKIQIPFEVYAFTSNFPRTYSPEGYIDAKPLYEPKDDLVNIDKYFSLMNLFTSKVRGRELEDQMLNIYRIVKSFRNYHANRVVPMGMGLSGTPLNETIVALHSILPRFQKQNKLEKVNCVILTDGEGSPLTYHKTVQRDWEDTPYMGSNYINESCFLRNRKTGKTYQMTDTWYQFTPILLKDISDSLPNVNFIGIRVMDSRDVGRFLRTNDLDCNTEEYKEKMRYYKKNKSVAIENVGYKVYFSMSSKTLSSSSDFEVEDDATKAQIKKAFTKSLTAKKMNKQILSRFVELIA